MTTLITGGGVIGSHSAYLFQENHEDFVIMEYNPQLEAIGNIISDPEAHVVKGSVLDRNFLTETVKSHGVTRIVHTVANPMLNAGAQDNPYDAINLNIMGTANILETARKLELEKVVFLSSATLTTNLSPASEIGKMSEDNIPRTTNIYSSTKLACENLGLNYSSLYGLDFVALRPVGVFGPWQGTGGGGRSNMMKSLMEALSRGKVASLSPWVGEIVYVKDVAQSVYKATVGKGLKSRIYNVGMGKIYTPGEIISIIQTQIPGSVIRIEAEGEMLKFKTSIQAEAPLDLARSKKELGYNPQYEMPAAMRDYYNWYRSVFR
ncbi:MAG: NAD-dependent epimerase/dehydratase family protein [Thermoplasmata archaeon]